MSLEVASHIISRDDFTPIKQIGMGTFGDVFLAVHKRTNEQIAVKVLKNQRFSKMDQITFMREVEILSSVKYPSILPFVGFSLPNPQTGEHPTITTKFADGGSLDQYINSIAAGTYLPQWGPTQKTIEIIGIVAAMRYLHKKGIIHRDLKPANVLLNRKLEPFVCDFGLSKFVGNGNDAKMQTRNCGTPVFMAPELFFDSPYNMAVDVYAFAMTLYNILTCKNPFYDVQNIMSLPMKVANGERPFLPETIPQNYRNLIEQCWAQNPNERPTFDELYKVFIKGEFNLPGSDFNTVSQYVNMLQNSETKTIEEYQAENEELKKKIKELMRASDIKDAASRMKGVAQKLMAKQRSLFERSVVYSRSSFDIHLCLGRKAPKFFGISGTPNLFVQFDFTEEIQFSGISLTCYDNSFSRNWNIIAINSKGQERVAFGCKDVLPFAETNSFSTKFTPIKAVSIRIEKTGLPNSISFSSIELYDSNNIPIFQPLIEKYKSPFNIPVHITTSNYFTELLYSPASEIEVFTQNNKYEWLMLDISKPIVPTGYRIKRDSELKLKGWEIHGSSDGVEWDILDKKEENKKGEFGRISEFPLKAKKSYRFFKIVPKKQTWVPENPFNLYICHFDVFD